MMLKKITICASLVLLTACGGEPSDDAAVQDPAQAGGPDTAQSAAPVAQAVTGSADILDAQGASVGTARFEEGETGVRISLQLTGMPEGTHGFHIHQVGECTAPGFESAGSHFNPTNRQHGLENPQGPHAGDMENVEVSAGGTAQIAVDNDRVTLGDGANSLFDADGSAIVFHAQGDDNVTDPSGNSGDRIACGVITRD
jgi:Cu-Zn family superoxide dismutase